MRIWVSMVALAVAGAALGLATTRLPRSTRDPPLDRDRIVLVAGADARLPNVARSLAVARSVDSISALDAALRVDTSLVVVDRTVALDAPSGSLRDLYLRGMPLMAINVSLADLYRLTGQDEELRAVDPEFAAETLSRASCEGACAHGAFWSLTWRSCAGDRSGGSMGPFAAGHATVSQFDAELMRQVALGPPCSASRAEALDE